MISVLGGSRSATGTPSPLTGSVLRTQHPPCPAPPLPLLSVLSLLARGGGGGSALDPARVDSADTPLATTGQHGCACCLRCCTLSWNSGAACRRNESHHWRAGGGPLCLWWTEPGWRSMNVISVLKELVGEQGGNR